MHKCISFVFTMKMNTQLFVILIQLLMVACSTSSANENQTALKPERTASPNLPLDQLIDSLRIDKDLISIHISKSGFLLQLKCDSTLIKSYPVVLGGNPVDDKRREGDKCTPEGEFEIRDLYPHKKWSKFLWLDYPTPASWKKFNAAKEAGEIPALATIGGEIGIHGVPDNNNELIDEMNNWTLGCISLKNADIDEIYDAVQVGTKVFIEK